MTGFSRRNFILMTGGAGLMAAGCDNGIGSGGGADIDARARVTLDHLYANYPGTRELGNKAAGILVMPLITEAGFGIGGSYGRGALQVDGVTVDYYSQAQGARGRHNGAQQKAQVMLLKNHAAQGAGLARPADRRSAIRACSVLHDRRGTWRVSRLAGLGGRC